MFLKLKQAGCHGEGRGYTTMIRIYDGETGIALLLNHTMTIPTIPHPCDYDPQISRVVQGFLNKKGLGLHGFV